MGFGDSLIREQMESDGAVRIVTLARPERRNALNAAMLAQLRLAFAGEPALGERVTVIRAEGPVFCSGVDLKERASNGMADSASAIEEMLATVERYPLPVVAVVQGDAIAGGNELALHCDFVVAADSARFGMSLAQIGLAPTWFLAKRLMEVGGPVFARRMLFLGDPLPASDLARLGLIHAAVAADDLEDAVAAVVDRLAANAPLSLRGNEGGAASTDDVPRSPRTLRCRCARRAGSSECRCPRGHCCPDGQAVAGLPGGVT